MKAIVTTTITSTFDVGTMEASHSVEIEDLDGLSEISLDVLGSVVMGALNSAKKGMAEKFPRVGAIDSRVSNNEGDGK